MHAETFYADLNGCPVRAESRSLLHMPSGLWSKALCFWAPSKGNSLTLDFRTHEMCNAQEMPASFGFVPNAAWSGRKRCFLRGLGA